MVLSNVYWYAGHFTVGVVDEPYEEERFSSLCWTVESVGGCEIDFEMTIAASDIQVPAGGDELTRG